MILWGGVTCCMAAVKTHQGLLGVRFVIGTIEAGFAPGVSLLLSSWYKRDEQAKRFALFYSAAVLSGAFGGIVAGAVTGSLDGARGLAGWQWLFIVEGASTMACAILAAFVLPDFPSTTKRFSREERLFLVERLKNDRVLARAEGEPPLSPYQAIRESLLNWRTWGFTFGYMTIGGSATMSYFYPTLVTGLGYTAHKAQYITVVVPIYAVAFVAVIIIGFLNDRIPQYRGLVVAGCMALGMVCAIAICIVHNFTARYVLLVFTASGLLASNSLSLAFASSTFGPMRQETRGVSLAFVNAIANLSQIYGAYLFPSDDAPLCDHIRVHARVCS
ncbi:hypothetical protein ANO11243_039730 [Dothideomycetidae sp. 11243]|nr:hypothetical protein ANO11243_039730 [fungal sp. No.11243]